MPLIPFKRAKSDDPLALNTNFIESITPYDGASDDDTCRIYMQGEDEPFIVLGTVEGLTAKINKANAEALIKADFSRVELKALALGLIPAGQKVVGLDFAKEGTRDRSVTRKRAKS